MLLAAMAGGCAGTKKEVAGSDQELLQTAETELKGKKYEDARQSLQRLINQYPDSELVAEARLRSAKALFDQDRYEEARAEYQRFLELFPEHERIDEARYYIGLAYFRQIERVDRDQSSAQQALSQFQILLKTMPDSTYAEDAAAKAAICRRRLGEKELYVGTFYFTRGQYAAAVNRYTTVLKEYAGIGLDDEALYYRGEALWRLEQREASAQAFQRIVKEFPESAFAPQAASRLGVALVKPVRPKVEDTRPWGERVKSWWGEVVRSLFDTPILQESSPAK
jgi:outer membrane protein assembly factor BamD